MELAITRRLNRNIHAGAAVAEIGVGGGVYSELLARRGVKLYLADVSLRLLDTAVANLRQLGLSHQILGSSHESATSLASLSAESSDAVLLLGPLYHLCAAAGRSNAVAEAARIFKPGGLLFFRGSFEQIELFGVESFTAHWQKKLNDLPPAEQEAWLELVEHTGATPEGLGHSDHFLYIGRRV